jgi:hypothetical protein
LLTCHFDFKKKQLRRKIRTGVRFTIREVIKFIWNALFSAPTISKKIVPGVTKDERNNKPWYMMYRNEMFSLMLITFLQSVSKSMMFAMVDGDQRRLWL